MIEVLFATTNARKVKEANDALASLGIRLKSIKVEIDEIQHSDPAEITRAKARSAFAVVQAPVVVSDTSWSIPALGGFPGGYMKDVGIWWKENDWLAIMANHKDRTIHCLEYVAYYDGSHLEHFFETYEGTFLNEARGPVVNEIESFERLVSLNSSQSLAEKLASGSLAEHPLGHWIQFGDWVNKQSNN